MSILRLLKLQCLVQWFKISISLCEICNILNSYNNIMLIFQWVNSSRVEKIFFGSIIFGIQITMSRLSIITLCLDNNYPSWVGSASGSFEKLFWNLADRTDDNIDLLSRRVLSYWTTFANIGWVDHYIGRVILDNEDQFNANGTNDMISYKNMKIVS